MNINETDAHFFKIGKLPSRKCLFCYPTPDRCLYETAHFRVLIDTYPIVPGHLMISSKDHYATAGELLINLRDEYLQLKKDLKAIAMHIAPTVIFYEHGKAGSCHATSTEEVHCEHFHLHCLPASVCIHSKIAQEFDSHPIQKYDELFSLTERLGSYLYFENALGEKKVYSADDSKVPPHYLRTLICQKLGIEALADWKSYGDIERYLVSKNQIHSAYQNRKTYALS